MKTRNKLLIHIRYTINPRRVLIAVSFMMLVVIVYYACFVNYIDPCMKEKLSSKYNYMIGLLVAFFFCIKLCKCQKFFRN